MENAGSGLITARFESDLTQKKNEKMIINEAIKAQEGIGRRLATEVINTANTSNVKTKVLEIEKKLQKEGKNENRITKFFRGKKDEKWPPPQGGRGAKQG